MTAAPGHAPTTGGCTVMLQAKFAVTRLFVVPPGAFRPAPNVDSAVARLVPLRRAPSRPSPTRRCSRASSPPPSASGARRCATRSPGSATQPRSRPPASIPARAARRSRSPISSASPTRSRGRAATQLARPAPVTRRTAPRQRIAAAPPVVRPQPRRAIRTVFCRDVSPRTSVDRAQRHAERVGEKAQQRGVRLAVDRRRGEPDLERVAVDPATSVRFAPGCTCSVRTSASAPSPSSRRHGASAIARPPSGRAPSDQRSPASCTGSISASCARTITISGDRSSVPPSGGTTPPDRRAGSGRSAH